jgi:hypothetical protein
MKQKDLKSRFLHPCLFCVCLLVIFSAPSVNAQSKEVKQASKQTWVKNCALRDNYQSKLIFTATQTGNSVSWVANNRRAYISVFDGLLLDDAPAIKLRREKILKLISMAPGGHSVIISAELGQEVDALWDDILTKAQSLGIKCN